MPNHYCSTSVLVELGEFSKHVERVEIERRDDWVRRGIVLDKVHRVQVDRRLMRVILMLLRVVLVLRMVVASEAVRGRFRVFHVTVHLVVAVQVEKSGTNYKINCFQM